MKEHPAIIKSLKPHNFYLYQVNAHKFTQRQLEFLLSKHNLTPPEWTMLGQLHEIGPLRLSRLAELLNVKIPFISNMASDLKEKGFVDILESKTDKRVKIATLTKSANKGFSKIEEEILQELGALLSGASDVDLSSYIKVLKAISSNYAGD